MEAIVPKVPRFGSAGKPWKINLHFLSSEMELEKPNDGISVQTMAASIVIGNRFDRSCFWIGINYGWRHCTLIEFGDGLVEARRWVQDELGRLFSGSRLFWGILSQRRSTGSFDDCDFFYWNMRLKYSNAMDVFVTQSFPFLNWYWNRESESLEHSVECQK